MTSLVIASLLSLFQGGVDTLDATQFAAILSGLYSDLVDCELLCEGSGRFVDPLDDSVNKRRRYDCVLQARYVYRRKDSATFLELYKKPYDESLPRFHRIIAMIDGKKQRITNSSDQAKAHVRPDSDVAALGAARETGSPERFVLFFFWAPFIKSPLSWGFTFNGWEDVGGYRFAKVEIDRTGLDATKRRSRHVFWVDLERGGNTLKEEFYNEGKLWYRTENVRLSQLKAMDGKMVWFPVHGEYTTFINGSEYRQDPVFRETYSLITGNIVINAGVADAKFDVNKNASGDGLKQSIDDFANAPKKPMPTPLRSDPKGVQEYQDSQLAEADRQAQMLDASPAADDNGYWVRVAIVSLLLLGIVALVGALYLKRR